MIGYFRFKGREYFETEIVRFQVRELDRGIYQALMYTKDGIVVLDKKGTEISCSILIDTAKMEIYRTRTNKEY